MDKVILWQTKYLILDLHLKNGMNYVVGQTVMSGSAKITNIIEDEAYFREYNLLVERKQ